MDLNPNAYGKDRILSIRLLQPEVEILTFKAKEAKMSRAKFLRNAIHYGGAYERAKFTREDQSRLVRALCAMGNNLSQIDIYYRANGIDEHTYLSLSDNYDALFRDFSLFIEQ